jgi:hypothetical protein
MTQNATQMQQYLLSPPNTKWGLRPNKLEKVYVVSNIKKFGSFYSFVQLSNYHV